MQVCKDEIFQKVKKNGVRLGKPDHYATMQFYMHGLGLTRAGYIMSNKNDEDVHFERVHYDAEFAIRLVARVERIINMPEPPLGYAASAMILQACFANMLACAGARKCRAAIAERAFTPRRLWMAKRMDCARWNMRLVTRSKRRDAKRIVHSVDFFG